MLKIILVLVFASISSLAFAGNSNTNTSGSQSGANAIIQSYGGKQLKQAPTAIAPGLAASAVETCMGSASAAASGGGWGISFGSTYTDNGCEARLDARTLFAFGNKSAAFYRLCERPKIADALRYSGTICPQFQTQQVVYTQPQPSRKVLAAQQPAQRASRGPASCRRWANDVIGGYCIAN